MIIEGLLRIFGHPSKVIVQTKSAQFFLQILDLALNHFSFSKKCSVQFF
jgi:hypothetical protein